MLIGTLVSMPRDLLARAWSTAEAAADPWAETALHERQRSLAECRRVSDRPGNLPLSELTGLRPQLPDLRCADQPVIDQTGNARSYSRGLLQHHPSRGASNVSRCRRQRNVPSLNVTFIGISNVPHPAVV